MAITYLPPAVLEKVWTTFFESTIDWSKLTPFEVKRYRRSVPKFIQGSRERISKKFEDWLFTQGAVVRRRNRQQYLEFVDEDAAVMFALKWT